MRWTTSSVLLLFPLRLGRPLGADDLVFRQRLPGQQRQLLQQPERGAFGAPGLVIEEPQS